MCYSILITFLLICVTLDSLFFTSYASGKRYSLGLQKGHLAPPPGQDGSLDYLLFGENICQTHLLSADCVKTIGRTDGFLFTLLARRRRGRGQAGAIIRAQRARTGGDNQSAEGADRRG